MHEYNAKGELQSLVIDPAAQEFIRGIALDFYGRLALIERGEYPKWRDSANFGLAL